MTLIILNYNTGDIDVIRELPDNIDDLSFFIETRLGYNEDEIAWMICDGTIINYATWSDDGLINDGFGSIEYVI